MRGQTSNARELKLYCLRESADELVERADRSQLGYREFLDLVLEDEAGVLEGRRYASHRSSQRCPTTRRSTTSTPSSSPSPGLEQLTQKRGDVSLHLDHSLNLLELGLGALGASAWPAIWASRGSSGLRPPGLESALSAPQSRYSRHAVKWEVQQLPRRTSAAIPPGRVHPSAFAQDP